MFSVEEKRDLKHLVSMYNSSIVVYVYAYHIIVPSGCNELGIPSFMYIAMYILNYTRWYIKNGG